MSVALRNPPVNNGYYENASTYFVPGPDQCFVYGSNIRGIHGAGAALTAHKLYGAVYGIGEGMKGRSYGIPTKDVRILTLPLEEIAKHVAKFVEHTQSLEHFYFVTAVGTGLAGYEHKDIAPMFKGVKNCWLPMAWREYIED